MFSRFSLISFPSLSFVLLFLSFGQGLQAQSLDCKRFKNGTFKIEGKELGTWLITRNGNKQVEVETNSNITVEFNVKWIDDCTYKLTATKKTRKAFPTVYKSMEITTRIIEVKANSYIVVTTSTDSKEEDSCEVLVVD